MSEWQSGFRGPVPPGEEPEMNRQWQAQAGPPPSAGGWQPPSRTTYEPWRPPSPPGPPSPPEPPHGYGPWQPPPPQPPRPQPAHGSWRWVAMAAVAAGIIGIGGGLGVGWSLARSAAQPVAQAPLHTVTPATSAANGALDLQKVAAKVDPAIVDINTIVETARGSGSAAGTGMILTSDGLVLTNNHVVAGSTSISVSIAGRAGTYTAKVIGVDPTADVALIRVQGVSGLPTVTVADSSGLRVGQAVAALGNALGQGGTPSATQGIITALDQSITASDGGSSEQLSGMIESDATISPGDSGGALVNAAGQVVGMITAGQVQGLNSSATTTGYAVPASTALSIANQIRAGKASPQIIIGPAGYIGVEVRALDPGVAGQLGLNVSSGVLVVGVQSGSPAEQAGIAGNTVITAIGGTPVSSVNEMGAAIHAHKPGDSLSVTWVDQSGTHTANLTLVGGPAI